MVSDGNVVVVDDDSVVISGEDGITGDGYGPDGADAADVRVTNF